MYSVCTVYVQYMFSVTVCTVYVQYMSSVAMMHNSQLKEEKREVYAVQES